MPVIKPEFLICRSLLRESFNQISCLRQQHVRRGCRSAGGKNAVDNNWLHVDEADKKKQLETKHDFLKQELTSSETKELATINQTNKARDEAIKAVCTDGNKGGGGGL